MATEAVNRGLGRTSRTNGSSGSMVRRIMLGSQLRRLRENRGVTREEAGYSIRSSESKISRMELGRVSFKPRDVADLLTLYGVTDEEERQPLLELARESNVAGWWHSYGDVLPNWFQTYVGLEGAAGEINAFELQFVHGLLQTEEYAHAIVTSGHKRDLSPADADRRVALRMERQKILFAERAARLVCVLDEAALHRAYGGRAVMSGQLQHLIDISEQPNIRLHVMPFGQCDYVADSGTFTLLRFPEPDLSDIVFMEQLTSALYVDKPDEVAQYDAELERLVEESLSPAETRDFLRRALSLAARQ